MRKSASKRLRVTKNGKVIRRKMAVDHFRTRRSTKRVRNTRKTVSLNHPMKQILHVHA